MENPQVNTWMKNASNGNITYPPPDTSPSFKTGHDSGDSFGQNGGDGNGQGEENLPSMVHWLWGFFILS